MRRNSLSAAALLLLGVGLAVLGALAQADKGSLASRIEVPASCSSGNVVTWNGSAFVCSAPSGGGDPVPTGLILLTLGSACPAGYAEESSLNGKFALGTVAANADVGGTGGQNTVTQVLNHTHPVTDPGHAHTQSVNSTSTGPLSGYSADTSTNSPVNSGMSTASTTTGVTTNNPAGGVSSIDNRPEFVKVIFCRKS